MALFNYAAKEITLKIVYYGPGLCGKTTNLHHLHPILDKEKKSKLLSLATEADRTLFFDFLPVELGKVKDFSIRIQLYTVPGQVRYNSTRKLVLKGADAVVFVADSQKAMREANIESFENMKENLIANNLDPDNIPVVIQFNKQDLPGLLSDPELNMDINKKNFPVVKASAVNGTGVVETFKQIVKLLIRDISKKHNLQFAGAKEYEEEEKPAEAVPAPPPPPMPDMEPEPVMASEDASFETGGTFSGFGEAEAEASEVDAEYLEAGLPPPTHHEEMESMPDEFDFGKAEAEAKPAPEPKPEPLKPKPAPQKEAAKPKTAPKPETKPEPKPEPKIEKKPEPPKEVKQPVSNGAKSAPAQQSARDVIMDLQREVRELKAAQYEMIKVLQDLSTALAKSVEALSERMKP